MTTSNFTRLPSDGWPGMGDCELALTDEEARHLLRVTDDLLWWAKNKHAYTKETA